MKGAAATVFFGSGAFAVPVLDALVAHRSVNVVGVVTAPPRAAGRHQVVTPSPVGGRAAALGLIALTPERLRSDESIARISSLRPELLVLADYGRLVPGALLDLPAAGALNLHPSLLPRHRGASPIPAAILAGDAETGVTLMRMDEGLDTGPIVAQRRVALSGDETAPLLEEQLAAIAAALLTDSLTAWLAGEIPATPQPAVGATLTRPLRREDGRLDPARTATDLERQVRAYQPWPGSFIELDGFARMTVTRARVAPTEPGDVPGQLMPSGSGLALATGDARLELLEVVPAGSRRMSGTELVRGRPTLVGSRVPEGTLG